MLDILLIKIEQTRRAVNFLISLKNRNLTSVNIYTTNRCNSLCKTCQIWKKTPKEDLPIKIIKNLLKFENPGTNYFLSGGEFILHPKCEDILKLFKNKNYILLSNGIFSEKLIRVVKRYKVKRVVLSFDGVGPTNFKVRGVDYFNKLDELIVELKKVCNVSLNYTISSLNNNINEIRKAEIFAKKHKIYLALGIYGEPEFFDTLLEKTKLPNDLPSRPYPLGKYLKLYNSWVKGKIKIPCFGLRNSCTIFPNGDVSLCAGKNIIIGNLKKSNIKKIWQNKLTINAQDKFLNCHDCWLICQKPTDIIAYDIKEFIKKFTLNFIK